MVVNKFVITKWYAAITDSGKDEVIRDKPEVLEHRFRLLDDDGIVYGEGYSHSNSSFAPLDYYQGLYGCVEIQYFEQGEWVTL
jgi:hypothetical protein